MYDSLTGKIIQHKSLSVACVCFAANKKMRKSQFGVLSWLALRFDGQESSTIGLTIVDDSMTVILGEEKEYNFLFDQPGSVAW